MAKAVNEVQIEGRNTVFDSLNSGLEVSGVKISANVLSDSRVKEIIKIANSKKIKVMTVRQEEIDRESESFGAQVVLSFMKLPEERTLEQIINSKRKVTILLLNHIDYEQNLGAIMRTAWAAGVDAIIASPNGVHEITSMVAKVSMGGAAYVPLIGMSLFQAIDTLKRNAIRVVGVEVGMGESLWDTELTGSVALVMGGESVGLSEPLIKACDSMLHIPMVSGIASLNVSVATALVMFEKNRQEQKKDPR